MKVIFSFKLVSILRKILEFFYLYFVIWISVRKFFYFFIFNVLNCDSFLWFFYKKKKIYLVMDLRGVYSCTLYFLNLLKLSVNFFDKGIE